MAADIAGMAECRAWQGPHWIAQGAHGTQCMLFKWRIHVQQDPFTSGGGGSSHFRCPLGVSKTIAFCCWCFCCWGAESFLTAVGFLPSSHSIIKGKRKQGEAVRSKRGFWVDGWWRCDLPWKRMRRRGFSWWDEFLRRWMANFTPLLLSLPSSFRNGACPTHWPRHGSTLLWLQNPDLWCASLLPHLDLVI